MPGMHGRSIREFEEQDLKGGKTKRSAWSSGVKGEIINHEMASTKHGDKESARSNKNNKEKGEFYLNFE
jgi:hypothetical protein